MRILKFILLSLVCVLCVRDEFLSPLYAQNKKRIEAELPIVAKRAKEIERFLSPDKTILGAPIADRDAWNRLAALPAFRSILPRAEELLKTPIPEASEALYKEYYKNGNRSRYQSVYEKQRSRVTVFALAEAFENQGRFISALEESIRFLCEQPSWVLPAHDANAEIFDGKTIYSDLVSTNLGCELALVASWFEKSLSPDVYRLIVQNVEERVLVPYENSVKNDSVPRMWWIRTTNNWNAVCHAGTVGAALAICPSVERRAWFVAASEFYIEKYFFAGFSNDGYCSEGTSYWNYGFGNFVDLAALVRQATGNEVDWFQNPKVVSVVRFAPNLEIANGLFAAFADCPIQAKPSSLLVGYLSRILNLGFAKYEERGLGRNLTLDGLASVAAIGFDSVAYETADDGGDAKRESEFSPPIRSEFADAGVWVFRPFEQTTGNRWAIAFKGGTNNEHHNHNDVGTYSLVLTLDGRTRSEKEESGSTKSDETTSRLAVVDPGAETYTARTFGSRRYEGELLNSFGHPVPRIDGRLQRVGGDARGIVVEKLSTDELDRVVLDISSAYDVPNLESARRTVSYRRILPSDDPDSEKVRDLFKAGMVVVEDFVRFQGETAGDSTQYKNEGTFESALISFENYEIDGKIPGEIRLVLEPTTIVVSAIDENGNAAPLQTTKAIVGENDDSVPNKPFRYGFEISRPVREATIRFRFLVQP